MRCTFWQLSAFTPTINAVDTGERMEMDFLPESEKEYGDTVVPNTRMGPFVF